MSTLPVKLLAFVLVALSMRTEVFAQTKMSIAQTGINPGTSLVFIARKENLFAKHGLDVTVTETTSPAAVQAMLGGSAMLTLGAAPAFVSATLE